MKNLYFLILVFAAAHSFAQSSGITYQAIIYNPAGEAIPGVNNASLPMANKNICLQFSILDATTQLEYQESVSTTTDEFGMVNLVIGNGSQTNGYATSFATISWGADQKSLNVALDINGQCSNFIEISNQKFEAVPYAFSAGTATSISGVLPIENGGTNATSVVGALTNLGLENVDNTSDLNKPISTATQAAIDLKEDFANKSTATALGTSDVLYPTQNAVKTYVDASATAATVAIANEAAIRAAADVTLSTNLATEVTNRTNADATLTTNLATEVTNRTNADAVLTTNLAAEVTNRTNADLLKEDLINKSTATSLGTSNVLYPTQNAVKTYVDVFTATTALAINNEGLIRAAADSVLTSHLDIEETNRINADAVLTTNLAAEVTNRTNADLLKENLSNKSTATALGTSDVLYPTQNAVKTYVDASATAATAAVSNEAAIRAAADATLTTNLAAEVTNRTNADATLTTNLAAEVTNRTNADLLKENLSNKSTATALGTSDVLYPTQNAVKTYVDASATAATAAIANEAAIRAAADATLTTNLGAEVTNRTNADATLTANLAAEVTNRTNADATLTTNLGAEVTNRTNADATLTTNLGAEVTNRTNADLLKEDLTNKSTATTLGTSDVLYPTQNAVKTYVDANAVSNSAAVTNEAAIRAAADAVLTTDLAAEVTNRTNADATLTTNLGAEVTNRTNADVTLTTNLGAEVTNRTNADATLTTNLATEVTNRTNADLLKEDLANKSTATTLGTSDVLYPTQNAVKTYVDAQVTNGTTPDATNAVKGKIQLAGDLSGSAATPVIANNAITTTKLADASVTDAKITAVSGSKVSGNIAGSAANVTGTVAIVNGGTGQTTIAGVKGTLGLSGTTVAIGASSGVTNQGAGAVGLGNGTGQTNQGSQSVAIGYVAGNTNQGANSVAIGSNAAQGGQGTQSVAIGIAANSGANNATALGGFSNAGHTNATAIGYQAVTSANNTIQLGADGVTIPGSTAITNVKTSGTITAGTVTYPNAHNSVAGQVLTTNALGVATWSSPASSGVPYTGATGAVNLGAYDLTVNGLTVGKGKKDAAGTAYIYNTAVGVNALNSFTGGTKNTAFGYNALSSVTNSNQNIAIGANAMGSTTQDFQQSVAVGNQALQYNVGSFNTALGSNAVSSSNLTNTATYLVGVGALALFNNSSGQNNTAVGSYALSTNTTGNNNTALGQGADVTTANLSNSTAIGYDAKVSANNTIQLGNNSVTNVKTNGTLTAGNVTYPNAHNSVAGQVLTTNASGVAFWSSPTATAASLSGTVAVANGGTGTTTLTGYVKGNGTSAMTASANIPVADVSGAAPLSSPAFTGTPTAPTAAANTNTTQIATTAFVTSALTTAGLPSQSGNNGKFLTTNGTTASWASGVSGSGTLNYIPRFSSSSALANSSLSDDGTGLRIGNPNGTNGIYTGLSSYDNTRLMVSGGREYESIRMTFPGDPYNNELSFNWYGSAWRMRTERSSGEITDLSFWKTTGAGVTTEKMRIDGDGYVKATGFKTQNGTSSQFLKANGTVDNSTYLTTSALTSPALTGTPTAPTAAANTNTTQIATTAFVTSALSTAGLPSQSGNNGKFLTTNGTTASWASSAGVPYSGATGAVNLGNYNLTVREIKIGTSGTDNYALGSNTVIGRDALTNTTNGYNNTAIGNSALTLNVGGYNNIAIGSEAQYKNLWGWGNVSLGIATLNQNVVGNYNTAVGHAAGYFLTSSYNTAVGHNALDGQANGGGNTAVGVNSGQLPWNQTTYNSTFLGYNAKAQSGLDNVIVIGYNAYTNEHNTIQLGNNAIVKLKTSGTIWSNGTQLTSDRRLKTNIQPLQNSMDLIMKLNPVHYDKKSSIESTDYNKTENGFIAQELQKVLPYVVSEGTDPDKILSVDYNSIIPILTKGIQEQQLLIEAQQKQIDEMKLMLEKLINDKK